MATTSIRVNTQPYVNLRLHCTEQCLDFQSVMDKLMSWAATDTNFIDRVLHVNDPVAVVELDKNDKPIRRRGKK